MRRFSRHWFSLAGLVSGLIVVVMVMAPMLVSAQSQPEETRVVVRAVSQDAKVIQDPVGGAQITIREAATGRVLARGTQKGDSGSTARIMEEPRERGKQIYQDAAKYVATIPLAEPTVVEITAEGPLAYPQALQKTSKTMLLAPGRHVEGDGVILTLHGFIVEMEAPAETLEPTSGQSVDLRARVRMLCGCPTKPGGMWDSEEMEIEARLVRRGDVVERTSLEYAGEESTFEGSIDIPAEGRYTLQVMAADPGKINFGMHERTVVVQ